MNSSRSQPLQRRPKNTARQASAGKVTSSKLSPTERRNPRSMQLDQLPVPAAVELMLSEEAKAIQVLRKNREVLARAVKLVARAFRGGD